MATSTIGPPSPQTGTPPSGSTRRQLINDGIKKLFIEPGLHQVVELRAPKAGRFRTVSGYFSDFSALADSYEEWDGKVAGLYYVLNPVNPALLARSANRATTYAELTTSDKDIVRRVWLLIDLDPTRPAGISSTDDEKKLAKAKMIAVHDELRSRGWPEPLVADSGNGYHLLYRIDLPNDDASRDLVKNCLEALAAKFDDEQVTVDRSVFNAARIVKAYGTLASKGDNTPERPHRVSRLLRTSSFDVPREVVTTESLQALAAELPNEVQTEVQPSTTSIRGNGSNCTSNNSAGGYNDGGYSGDSITAAKVEEFLAFYNVGHKPAEPWSGATKWTLDECPFDASHKNKDAAVFMRPDGRLGFKCLHNSCQGRDWKNLREELELRNGGRKFDFVTAGTQPMESQVEVAEAEEEPQEEAQQETVQPLQSAAMYGLLGEFIERQLPETESDAPALLFQGLACAGNFLGPSPFFRVRATKHRGNLFVCVVGDTAAGKGESLDCVRSLFEGTDWRMISGLNSGEGIPALANGDDMKIHCICEPEFARLLAVADRQGNTVGTTLRATWDSIAFQVINKNSPMKGNAYISLIGHITQNELQQSLSAVNVSNGFANRFLWVVTQSSKDIPGAGQEMDWRKLGLVQRLLEARKRAEVLGELHFSEAAEELWQSVYNQLRHRPDNAFGRATARARAQVKRMAMIFAQLPPVDQGVLKRGDIELLEGGRIGIQPLQAALEAWRYAEDSAQQIFRVDCTGDGIGGGEDVFKVKVEANKHDGVLTGRQLSKLFSHKTAEERAAIATRAGLKRRRSSQDGKGRPSEVWTW